MESTFDPAQALALVGHHYRADDYYEVGREKIREFARAVQDYHAAHWSEDAAYELGYDGLLAPLTFVSVAGMLSQRRLFETVAAGYDLSQVLQADQILEFHKPVVAGDQLTSDVYLESYRQVAGNDIMVTKNIITDQKNELVMVTRTTLVGRGGDGLDAEITRAVEEVIMHGQSFANLSNSAQPASTTAPPTVPPTPATEPGTGEIFTRTPRTARFEEVSVGDELPTRTITLTRGDLVNYAGVAGDANPIHWSDHVAQLAGLPNVVAHGMLTMGLGAGYVTQWLGDPAAVTSYRVRFSSFTLVDPHRAGNVEFSGRVKSLDPDTRSAVVSIIAKSDGNKIFGRATADVRFS